MIASRGVHAVVLLGVLIGVLSVSAPAGASERATAKKLVVTSADAGAGYSAAGGSAADQKTFTKLAICVQKRVKRVTTASVGGPVLSSRQDASSISSAVDVVKSRTMAAKDVAVISDPKFAGCLARVIQSELASQGVSDISGVVVPFKHYGNSSTAVQLTLSGTSNGQPQQLSVTDVFIQQGRAELLIGFSALGDQPFDTARAEAVLDKLGRRLPSAPT